MLGNMSSISSHRKPPPLLMLLLVHLFLGIQLSFSLGTYSNQTATRIPCRPDQASALLQLKNSFSTDGWGRFERGSVCTALASWRPNTDCCGWEGVRCSDADGRVTTLDLGGCGLESGSLQPALFDLSSPRYPDLSWNSFNGSQLPADGFERLTELVHLNLSNCGFDGHIPHAIGQLTKLVFLDLSTTLYLIDEYDKYYSLATWFEEEWALLEPNISSLVSNLSDLKELYLGNVDLSDNRPRWCSVFANSTSQLQVLSLVSTGLKSPICESVSTIRSLTEIDLRYNELYGQFPESFADLPSLRVLGLTNNFLEGWLPPKIFQNKNLTTIDVRYNLKLSVSLPNFSSNSIMINLLVSGTNFSGPIPSSIGNLKSLKNLALATTDFSQELPSSIGELRSLSLLGVSGTGIVGGIPSWIANLTSLEQLRFSDCGMSGEVPSSIGNLKNLYRLELCNCNFSGTLPPQMFNLTQMEILYLDSNNFHGIVELSSFWKLPELWCLSLSNNKLTVIVEDEGNSPSVNQMAILHLAACNLSKFPSVLRHMLSIQQLDLSYNQIHGVIPHWAWKNWSKMKFLMLSHNQFNSLGHGSMNPMDIKVIVLSFNLLEGPMPIPGPNTMLLDFSNNRFSSIPLSFGSHFRDINYIDASANNLSGKIPPSLCAASDLDLIDLSYNNLSGSIPSCLMEDLISLSVLVLKENQLQGKLPQNINNYCAFEALDLSGNLMEGQLPRSLANCLDLQVLNIGNNQIADAFPCWMSTLPKLEVLILKSNKFTGKVGQKEGNCEFKSLRVFDLASNNFSGSLTNEWLKTMKAMIARSHKTMSTEFQVYASWPTYQFTSAITYKGCEVTFSKTLNTLVVIDVSDNAFHGAIPNTIGDLVLLNGINMSHNALTGPIPIQIGALKQLEALDLSSNDLSGEIPQELASLDFLSTFNLSYNKLVGRIPESPHFLTFSNISFQGNIGLCGIQMSKECNSISTDVVLHHSEKQSVNVILFLFAGLGFGIGFGIAIVFTTLSFDGRKYIYRVPR